MTNQQQNTPAGYKQTELGMIPNDWQISTISDLCNYQNGKALEQYFGSTDGYKVVSIGNYSPAGKYVDTKTYISRSNKKKVAKYLLKKNDLAMILNDKTPAGTILGRVLLISRDESFVFNQRTMRLTSKGSLAEHLYWLINSDFIHKKILSKSKPGTQIYINTSDVLELHLPIPSSGDEINQISEVLSDIDSLITRLSHFIKKKRNIKQGAMQELLTGKRKLPGFSGEWKTRQLIEIANFYDNYRIPVTESKRDKGTTPYYGANDIQGYIKGHTHDGEFVLIAEDGANDLNNYPVNYVKGKIWVNNHAHVIQGIDGYAKTEYLSYALKTVNFVQVLVGGTRAKLNGSVAKSMNILIPTDMFEQTAITQVLSDMDTEIESLEKQKSKYIDLKQGMMQQLLTGKIRLI